MVYLADFCEIRGLSLQESYDMIDDVEREYQDFLREWTDSYGKLARSVLKQRQGIRLDEDRVGREAELRNLSRILNCLEDFADERGYSVEEAVDLAWYDEASNRVWDSSYKEE